jgi:sulfofructose kinase
VTGARSAFSTILVDQKGERTIVPQYDRALLSEPETMPAIEGFSMVMCDVRWPAAAAKALAVAREAGIPAILDADVAPLETLERLAPLASHIVSSEPAAEILTGEVNPAIAVEKLAARFDSFVAVTAGGQGVFWFDRASGSVRHCPAPKVIVRDTLAAGDVFHGAFALGLREGRPMEWIMAFASAAAAIKCSRFGGRNGAPNRTETEAMMADFYGNSL